MNIVVNIIVLMQRIRTKKITNSLTLLIHFSVLQETFGRSEISTFQCFAQASKLITIVTFSTPYESVKIYFHKKYYALRNFDKAM